MERLRTCIGCGSVGKKGSLARISRTRDGIVSFDATNRGAGRGAYVCSVDCLRKAVENGKVSRALRTSVSAEAIDGIMESLEKGGFGAQKARSC